MHTIAVAVGGDGAGHMGAVYFKADAGLNIGAGHDQVANVLWDVGVEADVAYLHVVAIAGEAGAGTRELCGVGAVRTVGQQVGNVDAAMVLPGELWMVQAGAAVEHTQADAGTGQAPRIGVVCVGRGQAPVGVEFVRAPAGRITWLTGNRRGAGCCYGCCGRQVRVGR